MTEKKFKVLVVDDNRRATRQEHTVGDGREQVSAPSLLSGSESTDTLPLLGWTSLAEEEGFS